MTDIGQKLESVVEDALDSGYLSRKEARQLWDALARLLETDGKAILDEPFNEED